jgi:hypothetical protein
VSSTFLQDLEKATKEVMNAVYESNVAESVFKLNSLRLNDSCDTNVVANIIFEKAMESPRLIALLCPDLRPPVFDTILEQSSVEIELDHGFDQLRNALSTKVDGVETISYQMVIF